MTSKKPAKQHSSLPRFAIVVAVCAVVLAGVYAIMGQNANQQALESGQTVAEAPDGKGAMRLDKSLSTGGMAAFVFKPQRTLADAGEFKDGEGNTLNLGGWKGRVALVNLWATWCAPCRKEMPHLAKLQDELGSDDFEVIALSVDLKGAEVSSAFLKEIGADNLKLYVDQTSKAMNRLGAFGLPVTILIDRQGLEIGRLVGPADWAGDDAINLVKAAIAEAQ